MTLRIRLVCTLEDGDERVCSRLLTLGRVEFVVIECITGVNLQIYYTPKAASWLNMIEIEFSALSKQCLNRRIATKEELSKEVLAVVKEREEKAIKIEWQFSIESARGKLNRHYRQVNADNAQYQKT